MNECPKITELLRQRAGKQNIYRTTDCMFAAETSMAHSCIEFRFTSFLDNVSLPSRDHPRLSSSIGRTKDCKISSLFGTWIPDGHCVQTAEAECIEHFGTGNALCLIHSTDRTAQLAKNSWIFVIPSHV